MQRSIFAALLVFLAPAALAHHAPPSYVRLDFQPALVRGEIMFPFPEFSFAMNTTPPLAGLGLYLLQPRGAHSSSGGAWSVKVTEVHAMTYLDQPYLDAT